MIVRCENCGTEFGFDDRQIGEGVTVRCSVCKHVFKVEAPGAARQSWQIRTTEDMSFTAPDVATLREWIDEGRLHPDDQVSRTGRNWVRLGDMPEFARAFVGFQNVAPVVAPVRAVPPAARPPAAPEQELEIVSGDDHPTVGRVREPSAARPQARPASAPRPAAHPQSRPASAPRPAARPQGRPASAPQPAARPQSRPASAPRPAARPQSRPEPGFGPPPSVPEDREDSEDALEAFETDVGKRRGVGPGLIAFLGVVAAVGVMFGVPSIRAKLLALGQGTQQGQQGEAAAELGPEVAAAEAATESLGVAELARAEADLQRKLDAGGADPTTIAMMRVALADLLLSRALAYQIAAALDPAQRESYLARAKDDQEDGERIVDSLDGAPDVDRLAEVRALARLAAGRAEAEVLPMVPKQAAETRLIVRAAVLWQQLDAPVPEGLVAGLRELPKRSGLGESALALALIRAGDAVAARNVAERLLVGAADQVVALAVERELGGGEEAVERELGGGEEADEGETDGASEAGVAKAPPPPEAAHGGSGGGGSGGGGSGGGGSGEESGGAKLSFDQLLDRGCSEVSSGDAAEGIELLLHAVEQKPNDLDVLVCLADGYAARNNNSRATHYYDRALKRSPSNIPALRGAAKVAARSGAGDRARKLYERLLAADPSNTAAKAYLAKHATKQEPTSAPAEETGG